MGCPKKQLILKAANNIQQGVNRRWWMVPGEEPEEPLICCMILDKIMNYF